MNQHGPIRAHAHRLYDAGLIPLPRWGGGHALRGTDHRALAETPPTRDEALAVDYSGGLAILLGTGHPQGGWVCGVDVDEGPRDFPWPPKGALMLERGTSEGRHHLYLRTTDRFDGQLNLRDRSGVLVAEIKGRGHALRSWPTRPAGKQGGYEIVHLIEDPAKHPPSLSARKVAEAMADLLSRALGRPIDIENRRRPIGGRAPSQTGLAQCIEGELARRGIVLRPAGRDGWHLARCPFHEPDYHWSFTVSFQVGGWRCWAGCGSGQLGTLAKRLGLSLPRRHRGRWILPTIEVST